MTVLPDSPRHQGAAETDLPAAVTDVRLFCPAALAWTGAFWATGSPPATVRHVAVAMALLTAVAGALVLYQPRLRYHSLLRYQTRLLHQPWSGTLPRWLPLSLRRPRTPGRPFPTLPVRGTALNCAVLLIILTSVAARSTERENSATAGWAGERAVVLVRARATSDPSTTRANSGTLLLKVTTLSVRGRGRQAHERVPLLVIGDRNWAGVRAGQTVLFRGRLIPVPRGDDVVALARAFTRPTVQPAGRAWQTAERFRSGLRGACRGLPPDQQGLLASLVLGGTSAVPESLIEDLRASGLSHLTAVSGTNVTIVVASVLGGLTFLGVGRRTRLVSAGAALAGFVLVARTEPSVLRASTMGTIGLLGLLAGHRGPGTSLLATATILLLWHDPWACRSPGLALSVAATAGLLLIVPGWTTRLTAVMPRLLAVSLAVPAAACVACAPVLALWDLPTSPVAVPANLLAAPAVGPATVLGALTACCALPCPPLAAVTARIGGCTAGWIAVVAHRMSAMPLPASICPTGALWAAPLAAAAFLAVLTAEPRTAGLSPSQLSGPSPHETQQTATPVVLIQPPDRPATGPADALRRTRTRHRPHTNHGRPSVLGLHPKSLSVLTAAAVCTGFWGHSLWTSTRGTWSGKNWPGKNWSAVLCDVGQGDALVVRTGGEQALLIDTGPDPQAVDACLRRLGIRSLELVIITHLHADHVAGLPGVMRDRQVGRVFFSAASLVSPAGRELRQQLHGAGVQVSLAAQGDSGKIGTGPVVDWQVLAPARSSVTGKAHSAVETDNTAVNDGSVVVLLHLTSKEGELTLLDLGDLEQSGQTTLLSRCVPSCGFPVPGSGRIDVVKVAHHGSARQVPSLYRRIRARIALVSVGKNNRNGHPSATALAMLEREGSEVLRTDRLSDLAVRPTGSQQFEIVGRGR